MTMMMEARAVVVEVVLRPVQMMTMSLQNRLKMLTLFQKR